MALPYSTSAVDINSVGLSWVQANRDRFLSTRLPMVRVLDQLTGRSGSTTYEVPDIINSLLAGGNLRDWVPGATPPAPRNLTSSTVTITCRHRSTHGLIRPQRGGDATHIFRDLETNVVPILLSEMYQALDFDLAALLINTANFNQKVFSHASALDDGSNHGNQTPLADINGFLAAIRPLRGFSGLALECVMSENVAEVLANHTDYSGGGIGSGVANSLVIDEFARRFQAIHRLDAVNIGNIAGNTAVLGATSSISNVFHQSTGDAILWFGLVDRRAASFDLTTEASFDSPDGALCVAMAREPEVISAVDERREVEEFFGRTSFQVYSPRGDADTNDIDNMGFFMKSQGNTGIFT